MELVLGVTGGLFGACVVLFYLWRNAIVRAADAEALVEDLMETNAAIAKSHDEMQKKYWALMVSGNKYDEGGGAHGALTNGTF